MGGESGEVHKEVRLKVIGNRLKVIGDRLKARN